MLFDGAFCWRNPMIMLIIREESIVPVIRFFIWHMALRTLVVKTGRKTRGRDYLTDFEFGYSEVKCQRNLFINTAASVMQLLWFLLRLSFRCRVRNEKRTFSTMLYYYQTIPHHIHWNFLRGCFHLENWDNFAQQMFQGPKVLYGRWTQVYTM